MNCLRKEFDVELNLLPREFGLMDMARKNLFYLTKNKQNKLKKRARGCEYFSSFINSHNLVF